MDEFSYRLRYFVASVIEDAFSGLFQDAVCLPFGSSSNRFGQRGADLDLSLALNNPFKLIESNRQIEDHTEYDKYANGVMFFQTRPKSNANDRQMAKDYLEFAGFILQNVD